MTDNDIVQTHDEGVNRETQNDVRQLGNLPLDINTQIRHQNRNLGISNYDQNVQELHGDMQHHIERSANLNVAQTREREIQYDTQRFGELRLTESDVRRLSQFLRDADDTSVGGRVTDRKLQSEARELDRGFRRGIPSDARQPNTLSANCGVAGVRFRNSVCELHDDTRHVRGNPIRFGDACSYDNDPNYVI